MVFMVFGWFPWFFKGVSWFLVDFHGFSRWFHGFSWILVGFLPAVGRLWPSDDDDDNDDDNEVCSHKEARSCCRCHLSLGGKLAPIPMSPNLSL